jgi:hypothetical protein
VAGKEGIPLASKEAMMLAALSVDKVKLLATEELNDESYHKIFVDRMSSVDDARQQHQIDSPQHSWHTDGAVPHLTVLCSPLTIPQSLTAIYFWPTML